jgi:hypothetical protein
MLPYVSAHQVTLLPAARQGPALRHGHTTPHLAALCLLFSALAPQASADDKFADYKPTTAFFFPGQGAQSVGMAKVGEQWGHLWGLGVENKNVGQQPSIVEARIAGRRGQGHVGKGGV